MITQRQYNKNLDRIDELLEILVREGLTKKQEEEFNRLSDEACDYEEAHDPLPWDDDDMETQEPFW